MITSSRSGFSLARWEEDEELGKIEPLKEPFPKPATNIEVGAEPLQPSAWTAKFCWLEEALPVTIFEFNSSTRDIKSSIRSLSVEICSQSWLMTPYKKEIEHLIKYSREELESCFSVQYLVRNCSWWIWGSPIISSIANSKPCHVR